MYVSYDYYRIFYYAAKYLSFTRAAEVLMSNQPNVTRSIKNLENELGCKLFVRSNRKVTLTPEGEKLYAHIAVAFRHISEAENELLLEKTLQSGSISIGTTEVALHCFLLPILKKFRENYPKVRIRVSNHSTPQAVKALKDGLIDFAVVTTPLEVPESAGMTVLKEFKEAAVCGTAYPELTGKKLTLAELSDYPLICLGAQTKTYEFYSEWFAKSGLTLAPDIEVATADQILPMVKNDLGIGFVPEEFLEMESGKTEIYRLELKKDIPARCICLLKNKEHFPGIAAGKLEQMMKETIEKTF